MLFIALMMITGILVGFLLNRWNLRPISKLIIVLIWILLFVLGLEVGSNQNIISNLGTLGLEALVLCIAATLGSVTMALILWKIASRPQQNKTQNSEPQQQNPSQPSDTGINIRKGLQGSMIIVGFFILGIIIGLLDLIPDNIPSLETINTATLFLLVFSVGISIGNDRNTLRSFKNISPLLALLPAMTISGTWIGSMLCAPFLDTRSVTDCLAVGSGLGYYSLSSIIISSAKGADLGTIALISNIIREIITLVGAPLLAHIFGRLAPIAAAGSTSADTTLPVISQICGKELTVVSIYHGIIVDFLVPFMVTFFCAI